MNEIRPVSRPLPARQPDSQHLPLAAPVPAGQAMPPAGEATAAAPKPRASRVRPHELQLAGYLLARAKDGRPIEGDDLARLRAANLTVKQTREALLLGRGNVRTDVRETNGESELASAAARFVRSGLKDGRGKDPAIRAAISQLAKAGTCGDFANLTVHKFGQWIADGDAVHLVRNDEIDHGWVEARSVDPARPVRVMDAWATGPAIHAEDGRFSAVPENDQIRRTELAYDRAKARMEGRRSDSWRTELAGSVADRIDAMKTYLRSLDIPSQASWNPTPVLSAEFADRVDRQMAQELNQFARGDNPERMPPHLVTDMLASHIARQLGASIKEGAQLAPEIVDELSRLVMEALPPASDALPSEASAAQGVQPLTAPATRPGLDASQPAGPSRPRPRESTLALDFLGELADYLLHERQALAGGEGRADPSNQPLPTRSEAGASRRLREALDYDLAMRPHSRPRTDSN